MGVPILSHLYFLLILVGYLLSGNYTPRTLLVQEGTKVAELIKGSVVTGDLVVE